MLEGRAEGGLRAERRGAVRTVRAALGALAVVVLGTACERTRTAEKAGAAGAPPPPAVVVTEVLRRTVPVYSDYVARTVALETVELRARVEGFLEQAPFREGELVKKGQTLFVIQPAQYEAALQAARGQLDKARADLQQALEQVDVLSAQAQLDTVRASRLRTKQDVDRFRPLAREQAIPQQDLDTAVARDLEAQAQVQAAEATLKNVTLNTAVRIDLTKAAVQQAEAQVTEAELNLGYTVIKAPVDGIIGVRKVDSGNLVGRGEATLLATMSTTDPFKVEFNVSELDFLRFIKRRANQAVREGRRPDLTFQLVLADDSIYPYTGRPRTLDRALDPQTGTILVEALFPNPENLLRAGQFARVRTSVEMIPDAVLVPQRSVLEVQGAKSVLVVEADDKVSLRSIKTGDRSESFFVVLDGLRGGEHVIVEGIQKARPGMQVKPTMQAMTAEPGPTPSAPAEPSRLPRSAPRAAASPDGTAEPGVSRSGTADARSAADAAPRRGPDGPGKDSGATAPPAPPREPTSPPGEPPIDQRETLVLRVLGGEPAEAVAREGRVAAADLERWKAAFLAAGRRGLERAR